MNQNLVRVLSAIFPGQVASYAYQQLTSPQVRKLREREMEVLNSATRESIVFQGFDIQTYHWPGNGKKLLLVHGWEGQAGNFADIVLRLQAEGYDLYAFDGPSHGFSSKGKTSLFEFAELVEMLLLEWRPSLIISHSFGAIPTTYALSLHPELAIEKYLMLTTPDRFIDRIDTVANDTGISEKVKNKLIERLELELKLKAEMLKERDNQKNEINLRVESLNVRDFIRTISVKEVLIIHDKDDRVLPITYSRYIAEQWAKANIWEIEGTGHFRMLRTEFVLNKVVEFFETE